MEAINVKKTELLETVRANRAKHRQIFLEAQEGYRKAAIRELETMLDDAREGRVIRRSVRLLEPVDQTKDYDRVIRMLEMSQDDFIQLEEGDFAQYVLDDWHWKRQFLHANSAYSVTAARMNASVDWD